jgi:hypothetical protein
LNELTDPAGGYDIINGFAMDVLVGRIGAALEQEQDNLSLLFDRVRSAAPATARRLHGEMKRG